MNPDKNGEYDYNEKNVDNELIEYDAVI